MPWSVGLFLTVSEKMWFVLTVETFPMPEKVWFLLWLHPLIYSEFFKKYHVFDLCDLEIKFKVIHLGDVTLTHQGPLILQIPWISHGAFMENWGCHEYFHGWSIYGSSLNHMNGSSDWDQISICNAAISQASCKKISAKFHQWFSGFRVQFNFFYSACKKSKNAPIWTKFCHITPVLRYTFCQSLKALAQNLSKWERFQSYEEK